MDKKKLIKKQILTWESASLAELKEAFTEYYGFECGTTNARNLRSRLACKIQELFLGGLSEEDSAVLKKIADNDPDANLRTEKNKPRNLTKGARFIRDWKGKTYEVCARDDGKFEYNGDVYRSLTAVATAITGTHWNGKKFFGVR
jgi:hypothetical protein